jgi:hypothetical protein
VHPKATCQAHVAFVVLVPQLVVPLAVRNQESAVLWVER